MYIDYIIITWHYRKTCPRGEPRGQLLHYFIFKTTQDLFISESSWHGQDDWVTEKNVETEIEIKLNHGIESTPKRLGFNENSGWSLVIQIAHDLRQESPRCVYPHNFFELQAKTLSLTWHFSTCFVFDSSVSVCHPWIGVCLIQLTVVVVWQQGDVEFV